jgi:glutaredoxin
MRRVAQLAVVVLCTAPAIGSHAAQTLYKSIDSEGKVIYSDRPPVEGRLEKTLNFEDQPGSALPPATSAYVEQLRRSGLAPPQVATAGIVLYSATWCGFCKRAKAYLAGKGIKYRDFDIDTRDGMNAFAQAGGGKGVPLLIAGGRRVQGFSPAAYNAFFAMLKQP